RIATDDLSHRCRAHKGVPHSSAVGASPLPGEVRSSDPTELVSKNTNGVDRRAGPSFYCERRDRQQKGPTFSTVRRLTHCFEIAVIQDGRAHGYNQHLV